MGRQWLHDKRVVASLKKSQATSKIVREIMVAARMGGPDPALNARLAAACEKARKESTSREVIERAIRKGAGIGEEKVVMEAVTFEGFAPHRVPVIVEAMTDNNNRTSSEIRVLFRKGALGTAGSVKFMFDHVGLVEAHTDKVTDLEEIAIEAGANEVEPLTHAQNDDIPEDRIGARFITERSETAAVSQWLTMHGWEVVTSELGYIAKDYPPLTEEQAIEVGEFLHALDQHEDVTRVWAAVR